MDPAVDLLKTLIAIDSVNPSLVPGASGEAAVGRALAEHMRALGLTVQVQEVAPGRPNVVGVLDGRNPGRSLMLCGHIDTVGVAGMSRPFDPVERDGRIYGRGSQDMKSGVAAMVDAARVIADGGGLDAGQLIVACVVDEEHASIGADALVTRWRADGAVVTEPTELAIAIAHKGFEWVEIETEGRAAHGSRPRDGRDAIRLMGRVLSELDALDRTLQARSPHPLLGTASLARLADSRRPRAQLLSGSLPPADGTPNRAGRAAWLREPRSGGHRRQIVSGRSRVQGGEPADVRALAIRDRCRPSSGHRNAASGDRESAGAVADRDELLDRRVSAW